MVQIPELDVSVPNSHKVGPVLREGDGRHLTGHLVSRHHHIHLQENHTRVELRSESSDRYLHFCVSTHLPGPDVDHHVVLVSHADDVLAVGRKRHAGDAVFVLLELCHVPPLRHVPQPHGGHVTALIQNTRGQKKRT